MYLLEFEHQNGDYPKDDNGDINGSSEKDARPQKPLKIALREFGHGEVPP